MPESTNHTNQKTPSLPPDKKKIQKKTWAKMSLLIFLFAFAISLVLYFLSPLSDVGLLSVSGNEEVPDQEIVNISQVRSGESLWKTFFSKNEIETRIEENHPQVEKARMKWSGLNEVEFDIEEWQTIAYLSEDEHYHKILENGTILEEPHTVSIGNMPIFINFTEGEALDRILNEFSELDDTLHQLISEVKHIPSDTNTFLVQVYMNDGNQVLASIPTFSERLQYYPAMVQAVEGEKGLFDFEAGAFFTPFNPPENDEENETESLGEIPANEADEASEE